MTLDKGGGEGGRGGDGEEGDDGRSGRRGGRRGGRPRGRSGPFVIRGRGIPPPIGGRDAGKGGGQGGPLLPSPGRGNGRVGDKGVVQIESEGGERGDVHLLILGRLVSIQVDAPAGGDTIEGQVGGEDEMMQQDVPEAQDDTGDLRPQAKSMLQLIQQVGTGGLIAEIVREMVRAGKEITH
ncbi:protein argonaute 2-like [Cryptomeria japonica]|uniref:protein argonaute 2-like n=1 Tax=Cryptomeria japonica TaxID=3369 RepID=UPI0027DA25A6|nr:protein argonaute 2-like [Cryptomeria japonica]